MKRIMKALIGAIFGATIFFIILPLIFINVGISIGLTPFFTYAGVITGMILIIMGVIIFFYCSYLFYKKGRGTPAPFEPTRYLVRNRIYKYSRNPIYIGYMCIIIGEIFLGGAILLIFYAILIFSLINWYVIFVEEPRLEKKFGKSYKEYKNRVPRWI